MATHLGGRAYVITWIGLLGLTALSFITSLLELGMTAETAIALAIATTKATWVALVFMHLLKARFANRVAFATAVFFVALLCGLMVVDVETRHTFPQKAVPRAEAPL